MSENPNIIVVYVAGPYRAATEAGVHANIQAARAVAIRLWRPGVAVICPHLNTAFFGGSQPDSVWLDGDLAILKRCDVVVTVSGWSESAGARAEVEFARQTGIPVRHGVDAFEEWRAAC